MVRDEAAANDIIAVLHDGADFAATARRSSQDATAEAGGNLGFVQRDGLNAELGAAAFVTPPGQVAPFPVRSLGSWFVIKVEERRRQPTPSFSVAREPLMQAMLRERVPQVIKSALTDMTVREYTISGKEVPTPMLKGGGPLSQ